MAHQVNMNEPASAIAGVLEYRMKTLGFKFNGHVASGSNHKEKDKKLTVLNEFRRKQSDLLYTMNKRSDNYIAENLFKRVGAGKGGHENTAKTASYADMQSLAALGIDTSSIDFFDGSGLSRRNKISSKLLCDMLAKATEKDYYQEFDSTLAIAGFDGTISKRFHNTKARLNLHAKTGTHSNVSALAGYVRSSEGERLCFAFLFNGPSVGQYKFIENEIGRMLAEYPNVIVKAETKKRKK
jgi:D-alanyl-D-alanine carboxypeptidase/D-alanyl-D-alanine-endopeptidase (penicillin-binding protein 4)